MLDTIINKLGEGPGGCLLFLGVLVAANFLFMALPYAVMIAIIITICTYWYKLFVILPTAWRIVLVIASLVIADYFNTHRDNFVMLFGVACLIAVFYMLAKTNTYHGQEDDFHNNN